jgi:hypothetical protein
LGIRAQSAGKNTAVCGIIILLYFGAYAFFRISNDIVHFQNQGHPQGHEVKATAQEWADLSRGLGSDSDPPLVKLVVAARKQAPNILNAAFWPLRAIEVLGWKFAD